MATCDISDFKYLLLLITLLQFILSSTETMSRKRQLHAVLDLDGLQEPIANASVEGLITSISPIKKGKTSNYFDGTVADSMAKIRLVGFTASRRK